MAPERKQLTMRLLTAAVGVPAVIVCSLVGGYPFILAINFVIGLGLYEFYRMLESKGIKPYKTVGVVAGLVVAWYVYFQGGFFSSLFITLVLLTIMVLELFRRDGELAVYHISSTIFGVFYVGWLGSHVILLRQLGEGFPGDDRGGFFVILAFALAWGSDTGAYFVGHAIGRRKLLPRVSPAKSVEGAIGGLLFGALAAVIARISFAPFLSWLDVLALGLVSPVMATLGDLVESLMKRDVKIKDTSNALPGHGGMLDRFDSVLFVAPFVYYYLRFIVMGKF
ncbi:MAG: phosphatidate cytidylyltransferase [Candidatus Eisenbacteria bacterium]|nr:phosphatidate cytidylyltransferase [Candidatus Eisenbacteria bacterium]